MQRFICSGCLRKLVPRRIISIHRDADFSRLRVCIFILGKCLKQILFLHNTGIGFKGHGLGTVNHILTIFRFVISIQISRYRLGQITHPDRLSHHHHVKGIGYVGRALPVFILKIQIFFIVVRQICRSLLDIDNMLLVLLPASQNGAQVFSIYRLIPLLQEK